MRTKANFFDAVAKYCQTSSEKVKQVNNLRNIVEQIILPYVFTNNGLRSADDEFMNFMATWGKYCFEEDTYSGSILYEIGMSRISSCSPNPKVLDINPILPKSLRKFYPAATEQNEFNDACWNFLKENIDTLFCDLPKMYRDHAIRIVFGIMDSINEYGEVHQWPRRGLSITPDQLRNLVEVYVRLVPEIDRWKYLIEKGNTQTYNWVKQYVQFPNKTPVDAITVELAQKWREHKDLFKDYFYMVDWSVFFAYVTPEKENLFSTRKTKFLKTIGLYKYFAMREIKNQILA